MTPISRHPEFNIKPFQTTAELPRTDPQKRLLFPVFFSLTAHITHPNGSHYPSSTDRQKQPCRLTTIYELLLLIQGIFTIRKTHYGRQFIINDATSVSTFTAKMSTPAYKSKHLQHANDLEELLTHLEKIVQDLDEVVITGHQRFEDLKLRVERLAEMIQEKPQPLK